MPNTFKANKIDSAKNLLTFFENNNIEAYPKNYLLFYEYFILKAKDVVNIVNKFIDGSPTFSQESLDTLYAEIYGNESIPTYAPVNILIERINLELAALIDAVQHSKIITEKTQDRMKEYSKKLKEYPSEDTIKSVISKLLNDMQDIHITNHKLQLDIKEKTATVKKLHKELEDTKKKTMYDNLTGIYNRRVFELKLKEEIDRTNRYGSKFCIAFMDLDDFKMINDKFGHQAGDLALQKTAIKIAQNVRRSDIVARYGGEEFGVIFTNCTLEEGDVAAEKLRLAIRSEPLIFKGGQVKITTSIGIAQYNKGMDLDQIINIADKAMYSAKYSTKDAVRSEKDIA